MSVSVYLQLQNGCRVLEVVEQWAAHIRRWALIAPRYALLFFWAGVRARESEA
jgi:hypothetical protein